MSYKLPFSEIAEVVMGQSPTKENVNTELSGLPLLNGPTEFTTRTPIPVQYTTDGKKFSKPNDILFCVRGSTTGRMNYSDQKYAIGRGIAAIRGKRGYPTPYIRAVIEQNLDRLLVAATGSTFPNVGRELLLNFEVEVISPEEAVLANNLIVALEDKVESNRQTNQTLEQIAQALFKSWFVDFDPVKAKIAVLQAGGTAEEAELAAMSLIAAKSPAEILALKQTPENDARGSAKIAAGGTPRMTYEQLAQTAALFPSAMQESELGQIPEGWEHFKFEDVCIAKQGKYLSKNKMTDTLNEENCYAVWGGNGIRGYASSYLYEEPVVVLTCRGSNCGLIDLTGSNPWVSNISFGCIPRFGSINFLYLMFSFIDFSDCISGSAQPQITYSSIKSKQINFPLNQKLVDLFSDTINNLYAMREHNKQQNISLGKLRDALLPKLLSGEIELKNSNSTLNESVT